MNEPDFILRLIMSKNIQQHNFQPIRHDRLLQELVHDAYKASGKLKEPAVCKHCNAVYLHGRWQWLAVPINAQTEICPACHRIQDHYPAGFLTIKGGFFLQHRNEIMNLIHNQEHREKADHPLKRIMGVEERTGETLVTTTDIHLARSIGDALHRAYQGQLEYSYNQAENLLRVEWVH